MRGWPFFLRGDGTPGEVRKPKEFKGDYRHPVLNRLRRKAMSNELVVVVGDSANDDGSSLSSLAQKIIKKYKLKTELQNKYEVFPLWNRIVDEAEKHVRLEDLMAYARAETSNPKANEVCQKAAALPISNFIDLTVTHRLCAALLGLGKRPLAHAFESGMMGSWRQRNPNSPNVFFCFGDIRFGATLGGLHEQVLLDPQNRIQIENMMEMATDKDLLMLDLSACEAESMLHLGYFTSPCAKIVNTRSMDQNVRYWTQTGTIVLELPADDLLEYLLPRVGSEYSTFDQWLPMKKLIEFSREKEYDTFMSYFHGDKPFAARLENDLSLRGIRVWRDDNEIEIGDSFSDKLQEGLKRSYTFTIILTAEALGRPWVKEELRAAYNLRLAEELKILPVLCKDCEIPPFLGDYKYADFREEKHYSEQVGLLEKAIANAVRRARKKK